MNQASAWAYLACQQWNFSFRRLCLDSGSGVVISQRPCYIFARLSLFVIMTWCISAETLSAQQEVKRRSDTWSPFRKEPALWWRPGIVRRLEELKQQQQVAQAQYLLEDANTTRSSP
jgi:hypothetical protein